MATDGEVPMWSPDGSRIAFARCRITGEIPHESAECSLWVVPADERETPEKLAEKIDSAPVWSPDGRFVAFLRTTRPCTAACESRIMAVPAEGGDARPVGPELVEPNELYWLPDSAAAVVARRETSVNDPLELQRCVDIWNRARMDWPKTAANVRLGEDGCQITAGGVEIAGVFATGFECWQPVPYSYRCASHGGALRVMDPQQRVWNAETDASAKLRLFDPPKAGRLPLPKAAPYPMFDGYIIPFDSKGQLRPGLTITETVEVEATCYDPGPDDYPGRCYLTYATCFRRPGGPADVVLCPEDAGSTRFHWVKLVEPREDPW